MSLMLKGSRMAKKMEKMRQDRHRIMIVTNKNKKFIYLLEALGW